MATRSNLFAPSRRDGALRPADLRRVGTGTVRMSLTARGYQYDAARALSPFILRSDAISIDRDSERKPDLWTFPNFQRATAYSARHEDANSYYNVSGLQARFGRSYAFEAGAGRMTQLSRPWGVDTLRSRRLSYTWRGQLQGAADSLLTAPTCTSTGGTPLDGVVCTGTASAYQVLAFQYDSAGNLTRQLDQLGGSDSVSATYAAANRLQTIGGASYTYDLDGNVATRTTGGITTSFTYDHQSQLTAVRVGADTTFYGYNAVGRLVTRARNNNSGTTKRTLERVFFWDADHLLTETDSTLVTRVAEYAYAPGVDRPLALLTPGAGGTTKLRYYHQDEVGHVIGLTDTTAVVQALEYTPWGELAPSTLGTVGDTSRVRWKGLLWEEGKTQLYYVRNRWYDAAARRFISEDPIGIDGGLNLYAFGGNDPVNHTDPYGLAPECISWWTPGATITVVGVETLTEQGYWSTFCYGAGNGGGGPSNSSPFTTEGGGAGGGSVGVTALTDSQPLQTRVCSAKQISFAVTAASDATLFLGGAGVVVRGLAGAARATRAANLIAGTPRLARTNRLAGAFADRRAAYWSIGHGLGQRVGGYYTLEEVQMSVAQVPEVSWRDFVPGFAAAKAYGEMKTACGY